MSPVMIRTTGIEDYLIGGSANVKALIIGEPGVGKSVSAAFWPSPIFLHCDMKPPLSLARLQVPLADIKSQADMDIVLTQLESISRKPKDERQYKTVVVDTLDAYQTMVINDRLRQTKKEGLSGYEDWGWLDGKMKSLLSRLLGLDMNLVLNVHLDRRTEGTGDAQTVLLQLKLKGDLRVVLPSEANLIGHMLTDWQVDTTVSPPVRTLGRMIQWRATPEFPILRDDTNTLPFRTPVNFATTDYEQLWEAMFGGEAGLDAMGESQVQETLEDLPGPEVVAPSPGGPVQPRVHQEPAPRPAAKTAAAKPAAANVPAAAKPIPATPAGADPTPATPVAEPTPEQPAAEIPAESTVATAVPSEDAAPPAAAPAETVPAPAEDVAPATDVPAETAPLEMVTEVEQAAPPAEETGVAVAEEVLGGTVIAQEEAAAAPVNASAPQATPEPAAAATQAAVHCGDPARPDVENPAPGCGRDLSELDDADRSRVSIAVMKFKTKLCPACLAAAVAAAGK